MWNIDYAKHIDQPVKKENIDMPTDMPTKEEEGIFGKFCIFCTAGIVAIVSLISLATLLWVLFLP